MDSLKIFTVLHFKDIEFNLDSSLSDCGSVTGFSEVSNAVLISVRGGEILD
jgi:hypothetical protein